MSWLLLQKLHGHVALLALAASLHPVLTLRVGRRATPRVRLSGYLASGLMFLTTALGWAVYPAYREVVRGELYKASVTLGLAFEVKEHLAFFALCLSLAGALLLWASHGEAAKRLRAPTRAAYATSTMLTLAAAALGIWLASVQSFPYGM